MDDKFFSIPTVSLRNVVVFPEMKISFDFENRNDFSAIEESILKTDKKIFLVTQRGLGYLRPSSIDDVYEVGVIGEVCQVLKYSGKTIRVLVRGLKRARLNSINFEEDCPTADITVLPDVDETCSGDRDEMLNTKAIVNLVNDICEKYVKVSPQHLSSELAESMVSCKDPKELFNTVAFNTPLNHAQKQLLLELDTTFERLTELYRMLTDDVEVLTLQKSIQDEVKTSMDDNQRDYYMREQIRVLSRKLGEDGENESQDYHEKIFSKVERYTNDEEVLEVLYDEAEKLAKLPTASQEAYVIRNYLDTVLKLPWGSKRKKSLSIKNSRAVLDKDHYGLTKVKERILETLAVQSLVPKHNGNIICLAGPPGIGKTSICKSIAKSIGREYVRISLGGVRDEADIRGHRKTYIGAMPGRITNAMIQAKVKNPVILLDEVDKMTNDFHGDPSSALLEVLDKEQNVRFVDHFIEVPYDLSEVMFITTANDVSKIPAPLLDRMELIELPSYTREEKFHIAKEHLIPKQIKENGLKGTQIRFEDSAIYGLIDSYTKEAGVRTLERKIASLCRKTAKEIIEGNCKRLIFSSDNLEEYLGARKYSDDEFMKCDEVGVVNGLAWTAVGGVLLPIETIALEGTGKIQTTGSLGNVMKESANIAVSYVRSIAKKYSIPEDFYKTMDIHIHAPEGATPKDGPSAGVTMVTSLVSTLANIPVRHDVAMTGEITLHGKVLPIGGLREKSMAGYKSGMKTLIIPKANEPDLEDVDQTVKDSVNFVFAETLEDVLSHALVTEPTEVSQCLNEIMI